MGGKAVKDVRPIENHELKPVYEWVVSDIFPLIGVTPDDAAPIGSFGKKPKGETSGDVDIAISAEVFTNEGLEFSEIATSINVILEEAGYETTLLKGFDQVSIKAPICEWVKDGLIVRGYAQVDLMPVTNLEWAKFMYHSPNIAENESKYKGAVRNALLMAIITESTKETTKLFEGKAEEYNSLAIRFPTGVWDIKRSFMGKRGKLVKKGAVLESEFITREPQDVIDLTFGPGYGVRAANSFETIWEVMHRKDFIHKQHMNEIMSKFAVNLKSMQQDTPVEASTKYPSILGEAIGDVLQPKSQEDITDTALEILRDEEVSSYKLNTLHKNGVLRMLPKKEVAEVLEDLLNKEVEARNKYRIHNRVKALSWMSEYLPKNVWELAFNKSRYYQLQDKFRHVDREMNPEYKGQTRKELIALEKELKLTEKRSELLPYLELLKGDLPYKSLSRIIRERIKKNQFGFFVAAYGYIFKDHPNSHFPMSHVKKLFPLFNGSLKDYPISKLREGTSGRKIDSFFRRLDRNGIIERFKVGNKKMIKANPHHRDDPAFVERNYYRFMKELYDRIEEYNIPELNEHRKELEAYLERTDVIELNEELLAHIGDPFDPIGLYKNPKRVDRMDAWVKAFLDLEGNMYIEDIPNDWLHKDMANELRILGKLNFHGDFYDHNFVTLIRIARTNNFAYTEGTMDNMLSRDIMARGQKKFPQYKFFAKHHEDVKEI